MLEDGSSHFVTSRVEATSHIAKDKDLDSLRNRDDFKQLLATLRAARKK